MTQANTAPHIGDRMRFIIDLEHGKPTCQLEKSLTVLRTLGIRIELQPPTAKGK